jgi:hypothetical protein
MSATGTPLAVSAGTECVDSFGRGRCHWLEGGDRQVSSAGEQAHHAAGLQGTLQTNSRVVLSGRTASCRSTGTHVDTRMLPGCARVHANDRSLVTTTTRSGAGVDVQ